MQRQSVCHEADGFGVHVEGQSMKISSYKGKGKTVWFLLVLAFISQSAVSCGAKDGESMTQAAEQVKAAETEPAIEESPVIEVKESDWERKGTDISEAAGNQYIPDGKLSCPPEELVSLDSIKADEAVLAYHYLNWSWGYQHYLVVINKEGRYKYINLEKEESPETVLLPFMDACLKDPDIPYEKYTFNINKNLLKNIISTQGFGLEKTWYEDARDTPDYCIYSVYGSGEDRHLMVLEKEDSTGIVISRFSEVERICEEIHSLPFGSSGDKEDEEREKNN